MLSKTPLLLYQLSKRIKFRGARTFLTTKELGQFLETSQQSASRYLKELEERQLIEREINSKGQWIEITKKGSDSLEEMYVHLKNFLELRKSDKKIIRGKITNGLGEGAYYVKAYSDKIEQRLDFRPYPGTLNIRLLSPGISRQDMKNNAPVRIDKFSSQDRAFGGISLLPAEISWQGQQEKCQIIIPHRTHHHERDIEVIHAEKLREKFGLEDGDEIEIFL